MAEKIVYRQPSSTQVRFLPSREEAIREGSLVLVAGDHSVNRAVVLHQLEAIGFRADADGQEAFERFTAATLWCSPTCTCHGWTATGMAEAMRRHEAERGLAADADHGTHGQRDARRAAAVPRRRHGRLRGEADHDPAARRQAPRVAFPTPLSPPCPPTRPSRRAVPRRRRPGGRDPR